MICTRRTSIKIRPELQQLDPARLERLTLDELGELAQQIEQETQNLSKLRRLIDSAYRYRTEIQTEKLLAVRARGSRLHSV